MDVGMGDNVGWTVGAGGWAGWLRAKEKKKWETVIG